MPGPTEHKTVQARILEYAETIGWAFVSQKEAEQRRGFDPETPIKDRAKGRTLFFKDLLDANPSSPIGYAVARVREFNPRYAVAEGALPGKFPPSPFGFGGAGRHLQTDSYGNPPSPKSCGGTSREFTVRRRSNRRERKDRREDLDFESLCSLRYFISATACCRISTPVETL